MWRHRLLTNSEHGNAPLESVFAMLFVMFLALGLIEVALMLYGRNVVMSSAHEGARAAVELGQNPTHAAEVAERTISQSAGGLVDNLSVAISVEGSSSSSVVRVRVTALLEGLSPVPVKVPVHTTATASLEEASL
jgi:Flp pilus assembly protein TadG